MKKKSNLKKFPRVIAVVGTSSFLGKNILTELEKRPDVDTLIAIDRGSLPIETQKTKFYRVDLTETMADHRLLEIFKREQVETVIHAAFPTTPPRNLSIAHEIISVGSMYICNACAGAEVKKLILASTTDVYGAFPDNPNYLTENSPTRGGIKNRFLADKIDAERSALKLAHKNPQMTVTILRPCHIFGETIQSFKTRYVEFPVVLTILGYDPLMQFVHESDVLRAFMLSIENNFPGIYNIVGPGVLPLSRVIQILRKINLPVPEMIMKNLVQLLWYTDMSPAPSSYLNFLKYFCVADGEKAAQTMGFTPQHSSRQTLLKFIESQRLKNMDLIQE